MIDKKNEELADDLNIILAKLLSDKEKKNNELINSIVLDISTQVKAIKYYLGGANG